MKDTLVLAVPRPVVLGRCLEAATTLGFGRIVLIRSWHVDKSHLLARSMATPELEARLTAGMRQSRRTDVPELHVFPLFRPFVEDVMDDLLPDGNRFIAHPEARRGTHEVDVNGGPLTIAIGPERGWTDFEVEMLAARDFSPIHVGEHPLRVETAVAAVHSRMSLRRDLLPLDRHLRKNTPLS